MRVNNGFTISVATTPLEPWSRNWGVIGDNVLYHSLSASASAEVNFRFTCRRKRLVARADGRGERCRMTFLATWPSAYI
jgi:hypothetical protein